MRTCNSTSDEDEWEELECNIHDVPAFNRSSRFSTDMKLNSQRHESASSNVDVEKSAESSWKTSESAAMSMNKAVSSLLPSDVIRPYCIVLNQKHTRIGVGHEFGFLVFAVNKGAANTSRNTHNLNMQQRKEEPSGNNWSANHMTDAETYLSLDPLYNMSLCEYNALKRQIRHARESHSCTAIESDKLIKDKDKEGTTTLLMSETCSIHEETKNVNTTQEETSAKDMAHHTKKMSSINASDDVDVDDDDDDLGLLLSYSKRHESKRELFKSSCKSQMSNQTRSGVAKTADQRSEYLHNEEAKQVVTKSTCGQGDCNVSEVEQLTQEKELYSTELELSSSPSTTEIDEHKEQELQLYEWQEEEEGSVGFAGGGVMAMALLYEQHCVAIVKTNKSERMQELENELEERKHYEHKTVDGLFDNRCAQLIQEGEHFHTIKLDQVQNQYDVIDKMELDAHLLFVCTRTMLLIYTNPLEPEWSACAFTITLHRNSPSTFDKFTTTPLSATNNKNMNKKDAKCERGANVLSSAADLIDNSTNVFPALPSLLPPQECQNEPYPFVLDFVNKLFLLPSADAPNGFTLWRYNTQCVSHTMQWSAKKNNDDNKTFLRADGHGKCQEQLWQQTVSLSNFLSTYQSCTMFSGKVSVVVEEVASTANAHRNCLANLALCKVRAADTATWKAYIYASKTNECKYQHHVEQEEECSQHTEWGGILLVAACSNYTTRITLWGLLYDDDRDHISSSNSFPLTKTNTIKNQFNIKNPTESANAINTVKKKGCFVLLREFRVGFRLPPSASSHLPLGRNSRTARSSYLEDNYKLFNVHNCVISSNNDGINCANNTRASKYSVSTSQHKEHLNNLFSCPLTHMQFLSHGHYIFCVQGTKLLLFATSPYNDKSVASNNKNIKNINTELFYKQHQEQQQQQEDVCTVRKQVDYNRYSMLAKLNKYVPTIFHLESYTNQAWSSCEGKLPLHDINFYPKWLLLEVQDKKARESLMQNRTTSRTDIPYHQQASYYSSPVAMLPNEDFKNDLNNQKESATYLPTRLTSALQSTFAKWSKVKNVISNMHINQSDNNNISNLHVSKLSVRHNNSNIIDSKFIMQGELSSCQSCCEKSVNVRYDNFHAPSMPSCQTFLTSPVPESSVESSMNHINDCANSVNEAKVEIENAEVNSILQNDQWEEYIVNSSNGNTTDKSNQNGRCKNEILQYTRHSCSTLAECLIIWESTDEDNQWTPFNKLGLLRLHCATCDGSHLTILLNKQTGTFTCTPATCFTLPEVV